MNDFHILLDKIYLLTLDHEHISNSYTQRKRQDSKYSKLNKNVFPISRVLVSMFSNKWHILSDPLVSHIMNTEYLLKLYDNKYCQYY